MRSRMAEFTQRRNWLIARLRGAYAVFNEYTFADFPLELREDAEEIYRAISKLERKLSTTWRHQKAYFRLKKGIKNGHKK